MLDKITKLTGKQNIVLVRGGGDLGSGIIHRLHRCGFNVVVSELPKPLVIRREVAYATALERGNLTIEGVTARAVVLDSYCAVLRDGDIPVLTEDYQLLLGRLEPVAVIDATLRKAACDTKINDAPIVIGIGPGFECAKNTHAIVETKRGHYLGAVYCSGSAIANTGEPGNIGGYTSERVLRAPITGYLQPVANIGDHVFAGNVVANCDDHLVVATIDGVVRGMISPQIVQSGVKIADIDPRGEITYCFSISEKARAIAGGALEALMYLAKIYERN
ncbi:MAG: selenium-dependent molybdenum cofactor biosynthesis protein YqeB [Negativicutes bacterium]